MTTDSTSLLNDDLLLTPKQTAEMLLISVRTLETHQSQGLAPRRIKIGPRRIAYRLADVRAHIRQAAETA